MGKAKDGSECFTRQNKSGGKYITCEGTQKARKSASKAKSADAKPKQKAEGRASDAKKTELTRQKKIDENVKTYKRLKAKYEKMKIAELRKLVPASVLGDAKTRTGFKTKINFVLYLTKKGLPHKLNYEDNIKMNKEVRKK